MKTDRLLDEFIAFLTPKFAESYFGYRTPRQDRRQRQLPDVMRDRVLARRQVAELRSQALERAERDRRRDQGKYDHPWSVPEHGIRDHSRCQAQPGGPNRSNDRHDGGPPYRSAMPRRGEVRSGMARQAEFFAHG